MYLRQALLAQRTMRWLTQGLFFALSLALLVSAIIIVINPTVPYASRQLLTAYAHAFYIGAGIALVLFVALAGIGGVVAMRRGVLKRLVKQGIRFLACFGHALTYAYRIWMSRQDSGKQTRSLRNPFVLLPEQRTPTAFGDYLGREYMNQLGRDETKLDPFALDNGPRKAGIAHFSLEDDEH